jgi:hypothetical protein
MDFNPGLSRHISRHDHEWSGSELKALRAFSEGALAPFSFEPGGSPPGGLRKSCRSEEPFDRAGEKHLSRPERRGE